MNYIELKTGKILTQEDLETLHPSVCIPILPDISWLKKQGLAPYKELVEPAEASFGYELTQKDVEKTDEGWYVRGWQETPVSREELIQLVNEKINVWRKEQEESGFWWNGSVWDSDPLSAQRITAIGAAGLAPPSGYWTNSSNQDIPVDQTQMRELYLAMLQRGSEIHDRQRTMKVELATKTFEELLVFQPDWPPQISPEIEELPK